MTIHIPHPKMDDAGKIKYCTEIAFNILVNEAHNLGLPVRAITGMESLGNAAAQLQFEEACQAVVKSLGTPA